MSKSISIILVSVIIHFSGFQKTNIAKTAQINIEPTIRINAENEDDETMTQKVIVDYSIKSGVPLFKKFALYNSGIVPLKNYERDIRSIKDIDIESLRVDLFIGNERMPFGNIVTGTIDELKCDFTKLDELANMLDFNGVRPYWSWCYIPKPMQISNDWRNGPNDLNVWREMFEQFSKHYKELGIPVYHEIYNEPDCGDIFFLGTWDDYLKIYKNAAQGLKKGDANALVGGPSTAFIEKQAGIGKFLQMIIEESLPLDFFSFHSYGYETPNYLSRVEIARQELSKYSEFDTTEMHMNELNAISAPWLEGGNLDKTMAAVRMLTAFEQLLEETDLTLVHWAQWLSSTVDGLGMIDKKGNLKATMHAYKFYNEMPLGRAYVAIEGGLHAMASSDDNITCLLLWNEEKVEKQIVINLENTPFDQGCIEIYKLDDQIYQFPENSTDKLAPIEKLDNVSFKSISLTDIISGEGIVYIRVLNTQSQDSNSASDFNIKRRYHYYPEREKSNYAEFDSKSKTVWLGMGDEIIAHSMVGISIDNAHDILKFDLELDGEFEIDNNTYLGLRVDYRVNGVYRKAVDFKVFEDDVRRNLNMPWGTGSASDDFFNVGVSDNFMVDIKRNAPKSWDGNIIITFDMQNTGKHTQAVFNLR